MRLILENYVKYIQYLIFSFMHNSLKNHNNFGGVMPIVTLENAGTLTVEQKTQLIKKLTDVVVEVTNKSTAAVYVRIDEVPRENFGVGGKSLR